MRKIKIPLVAFMRKSINPRDGQISGSRKRIVILGLTPVDSVGVGSFALPEAGLLDGLRSTTHWRIAQRLAERYPKVQVDPNPIWVKDGTFYTSAGISSGIDLALSLVGEDFGDNAALEIAKN